jgi:hypothetical protein
MSVAFLVGAMTSARWVRRLGRRALIAWMIAASGTLVAGLDRHPQAWRRGDRRHTTDPFARPLFFSAAAFARLPPQAWPL